jgi:hypothetical protein
MVIQGNPSRLLLGHFGVTYDPASRTTTGGAEPFPSSLADVVTAAAALGASDLRFEELLATEYPRARGSGAIVTLPVSGPS